MSSFDKIKPFLDAEIKEPIIIKYNNSYAVATGKTYRYNNMSNCTGEIARYEIITVDGEYHTIDRDRCEYAKLDFNKMHEMFIYKKLDAIFRCYNL